MIIRRAIFALSVMTVLTACGSSTSSDSSSSDSTTAVKPVETSEAPQSNSDFCKNAALATDSMESVLSEENSDASPEEAWKSILSYASKMLENAPNEIEKEAQRLEEGISDYAAVLAKYDYDLMAMAENPDSIAEVEAIDKDGSMEKASKAVDKYLEESCGIPQGS
jgi:hypothetical protein